MLAPLYPSPDLHIHSGVHILAHSQSLGLALPILAEQLRQLVELLDAPALAVEFELLILLVEVASLVSQEFVNFVIHLILSKKVFPLELEPRMETLEWLL